MDEYQDREFGHVGKKCAMKNCYNYGPTSLSHFRFPTDLNLCTQWTHVSGRKDLIDRLETKGPGKLHAAHRYCSAHFSPTSFKNPNNHSQGLRKGTVPTLFLGNPDAIQQQSPYTMQIGGSDHAYSTQLAHNGSPSPKFQSTSDKTEKMHISGLYEGCYNKLEPKESIPPPILRTPPTLPQSHSDPVPAVGTTKYNTGEIMQQMKTWKIENNNKTLRLKLLTAQKLTSRLKKKVAKMKNEIEALKRQALRYNENFIDISPGAIGENLLATLLRHGRQKPHGRRYGPMEKSFALEIHRCSQKAYSLVHKRLNLPTKRMIHRHLELQRLTAVSSEINVNAPEDALNKSTDVDTCM